MANKHKGEVEVKLGEDLVTMKFGFNAIAELEDLTGKSMTELATNIQNVSFKFIRDAVYCGTKSELKPGVTKEDVGDLLDENINQMEDFHELVEKVVKAINAALGVKVSEEDLSIVKETDEGN